MFLTSVWGECSPAELIDFGIIRVYNIEESVNVDDLEAILLKHCVNYKIIAVIPPSPWSDPSISCYKLVIDGNARDFIRLYKNIPGMPNSFLIEGKPYDIEYHFPQPFLKNLKYTQYSTKQNNRPPNWYNNIPFVDIPQQLKQKYCINITNKPPQWDSNEVKNALENHFTRKGIWLQICNVQATPSSNSATIVCTNLKTKSILLDSSPLVIDSRVTLDLKPF